MEMDKNDETRQNSNTDSTNENQNSAETQPLPSVTGGAQSFPAGFVPDPGATVPIVTSGEGGTLPPAPARDYADPASYGETMAVSVSPPPPTPPAITKKKGRSGRGFLITLAGVLVLLLVAAFSAYRGYEAGIELRTGAESTQAAQQVDQQFQLGVQEMNAGEYYRARQRFEYVIQQNPAYPGVTEKLADVLLELNTTATPTLMPTATLTPTPDLRGVEEKFSQGQQALANKDWDGAIQSLLSLRKEDPNYKAVEVDGMLFLALRNRGQDKIGKLADLEGGMYDLTLAEQFGPLDAEAQGYMSWANMYITGASFWEINWEEAVNYFSQIAPQMPYLRDGSGWTAQQRYRIALTNYGDQLAGQGDWCGAQAQYELALTLNPDPDEASNLEALLTDAAASCGGGEEGDGEPAPDGEAAPSPEP